MLYSALPYIFAQVIPYLAFPADIICKMMGNDHVQPDVFYVR